MTHTAAALVTDLIFATKITSTAQAVGASVKLVRSLAKLAERLAKGDDSLVIIDLNAEGVDVLQAITMCRSTQVPPRVIAYASHVQSEFIEAACKAGADEVMARSVFSAKLPALLSAAAKSNQATEQERGQS